MNLNQNVATPTKKRLRNFIMRYYYYNKTNPDKVTCKKINVKAMDISDALNIYDPANLGVYRSNLLNWTARRAKNN